MKESQRILNVHAPSPRPTLFAALCISVALSVPVAMILWLADWLWQ